MADRQRPAAPPPWIAMYYFKLTSGIGPQRSVDDYFETSGDGMLMRVVSHADGRWWASTCANDEFDELRFGDLEPASPIAGDEFERVWRLALDQSAARETAVPETPVAPA